MNIKTSSFCAISRAQDWQSWLNETAPDLLADLRKVIDSHKGCKANSAKMVEIYHALYARQLGPKFEEFITRRYPYIIDGQTRAQHLKPQVISQPVPAKKPVMQFTPVDFETLNKHKVFRAYRPDILSFPQMYIIMDHPDRLLMLVRDFIKDKIGVDYHIEGDRAYIEYFDNRYADVANKIPREQRDIYIYRQKKLSNGLAQSNPGQPPAK